MCKITDVLVAVLASGSLSTGFPLWVAEWCIGSLRAAEVLKIIH